ncbi:MAG: hypothetical protein HYX28_00815 [Candidatus Koribacter versatilis]|uniref:DUF1570 domain-containing protein n=1 Tax=Candidatus Korobacter versatilis TaxID=658062 RepID=A0A932A5Z1_9BACT|nr:hypothetical protein [Candidatus Koribacter versatilis]
MRKGVLLVLLSAMLLNTAISCGADRKYHFHWDYPAERLNDPGLKLWAISQVKTNDEYRVISSTRLNGSLPMRADASAILASGESDNWSWEVKAVPALLPSWQAWQRSPEIARRAQPPDDWGHPAATWEQAFARAHKLATYLLGRKPLPLRITVLLIPQDTAYDESFTDSGGSPVHMTFAFYYPAASAGDAGATARRFSALVEAVATTMHEYEHVLIYSQMIRPVGRDETDRSINNEANGLCWSYATTLALTSGTHTELQWTHATEVPTAFGVFKPGKKRRYSDAFSWAQFLGGRSTAAYLRDRGISDLLIRSNDAARMNTFVSVCRAMTQDPMDLTAGPYPSSRISYEQFFPSSLETDSHPKDSCP